MKERWWWNVLSVLVIFFLFFLASGRAQAQTRFTVGATGGIALGSFLVGPEVGVEAPITRHFEVDLLGKYYPVYNHVSLGFGQDYTVSSTPIVWLSNSLGLSGTISTGGYYTKTVHKNGSYATGGLIYRHTAMGAPARFRFEYSRQIMNGVTNGTETNRVQLGKFGYDIRVACIRKACFRTGMTVEAGVTYNQGNPVCDGSLGGPVTCRRDRVFTGGAEADFRVEFPRQSERELF